MDDRPITQTPFDSFSKEYLADLLASFGTVERSFEVPRDSKHIDLLFCPTEIINSKEKGLLNQVISTLSVLEPTATYLSVKTFLLAF